MKRITTTVPAKYQPPPARLHTSKSSCSSSTKGSDITDKSISPQRNEESHQTESSGSPVAREPHRATSAANSKAQKRSEPSLPPPSINSSHSQGNKGASSVGVASPSVSTNVVTLRVSGRAGSAAPSKSPSLTASLSITPSRVTVTTSPNPPNHAKISSQKSKDVVIESYSASSFSSGASAMGHTVGGTPRISPPLHRASVAKTLSSSLTSPSPPTVSFTNRSHSRQISKNPSAVASDEALMLGSTAPASLQLHLANTCSSSSPSPLTTQQGGVLIVPTIDEVEDEYSPPGTPIKSLNQDLSEAQATSSLSQDAISQNRTTTTSPSKSPTSHSSASVRNPVISPCKIPLHDKNNVTHSYADHNKSTEISKFTPPPVAEVIKVTVGTPQKAADARIKSNKAVLENDNGGISKELKSPSKGLDKGCQNHSSNPTQAGESYENRAVISTVITDESEGKLTAEVLPREEKPVAKPSSQGLNKKSKSKTALTSRVPAAYDPKWAEGLSEHELRRVRIYVYNMQLREEAEAAWAGEAVTEVIYGV